MPDDQEERFRQHEAIMAGLARILEAQHARNERLDAWMERQDTLNERLTSAIERLDHSIERIDRTLAHVEIYPGAAWKPVRPRLPSPGERRGYLNRHWIRELCRETLPMPVANRHNTGWFAATLAESFNAATPICLAIWCPEGARCLRYPIRSPP